jgi:hypothetical protein
MSSEKPQSRFRESGILSSPPSVNADSQTLEKLEGGSRPISQHSPEWQRGIRPMASPHGSFYGAQAMDLSAAKDPAMVCLCFHLLYNYSLGLPATCMSRTSYSPKRHWSCFILLVVVPCWRRSPPNPGATQGVHSNIPILTRYSPSFDTNCLLHTSDI